MRNAAAIVPATAGRVMCPNRRNPRAPSSRAASVISGSWPSRAVNTRRTTSGVHSQTSAIPTPTIAHVVSERIAYVPDAGVNLLMSVSSSPPDGLKTKPKRMPTTTGGMIIGRRSAVRTTGPACRDRWSATAVMTPSKVLASATAKA